MKTTPNDVTLPPRDLKFAEEFVSRGPRSMDKWVNDDFVETHFYNALSLTFPEGEKFFIEAVRNFKHLAKGKLEKDLKDFILQEAYHTREHIHFNQHLDANHYPLKKIDALVKNRLAYARSKGERIMLGATIVLEHFTAILAADLLSHPELFDRVDPKVKKMWLWHSLEESEHKAVTFDLWQLVQADVWPVIRYSRRMRALFLVSSLFMINVTKITLWLMYADDVKGPRAWYMYLKFILGPRGLIRRHFKNYIDWVRPGFHPWDHDNRQQILVWRKNLFGDSIAN